MEQILSNVPTKPHCHLRAHVDSRHREDDLGKGDQQHDAAHSPDVAHIVFDHTFINDVGVQRGKE